MHINYIVHYCLHETLAVTHIFCRNISMIGILKRVYEHYLLKMGLGHFGRGHLGRGHYGRGHLGRGHYGRGHFGRGHLGRGHFGPLI